MLESTSQIKTLPVFIEYLCSSVTGERAEWAEAGVHLEFIQPGKPAQNLYIKRFNRSYREEVPALNVFSRLSEVREITENWLKEYNEERSHESLGNMTPIEYRGLTEKREYPHSLRH